MQPYIRPILIGLVVGVIAWFLFAWLTGPGFSTNFIAVFAALFTAYILSNLAGNRKVAVAGAYVPAAGVAWAASETL